MAAFIKWELEPLADRSGSDLEISLVSCMSFLTVMNQQRPPSVRCTLLCYLRNGQRVHRLPA